MQAVSLALGVLRRSRSSTLCRSPIAQRLADARHYFTPDDSPSQIHMALA